MSKTVSLWITSIVLAGIAVSCASSAAQAGKAAAQHFGIASFFQDDDLGKGTIMKGTISHDGKSFVDKGNKSWTVSNPEALKGHEGRKVTLRAYKDAAKNGIRVLSVEVGKGEMKESKPKDARHE